MPVLGVYVGEYELYFVHREDSGNLTFSSFPFVYSPVLYGHLSSSEKFYKEIFTHVCGLSSKDKFTEHQVISTAFPVAPRDLPNNVLNISLDKVLLGIKDYNYVLIDRFTIISGLSYICSFPYQSDELNLDLYSNLSVYGHPIPFSEQDFQELDSFVKKRFVSHGFRIAEDVKPLVFTGGRFSWTGQSMLDSYLLVLDLITTAGIYDVRLDTGNFMILTHLLAGYLSSEHFDAEKYLTTLGTVVKTTGSVECLVENEFGTSQLLEVKEESLFIMPLDSGSVVRVVLKNEKLPQKEKKIHGGELGLIIDTRDKSKPDVFSAQNSLRWQQVIKQMKGGF